MEEFKKKITFSGLGGQGILLIGSLFAESCVDRKLYASWLPSYGMEMRGGTCNCAVVVSNEAITNPIIQTTNVLLVLNQASYQRFSSTVKQHDGIILYDADNVTPNVLPDVRMIGLPATQMALGLGNVRLVNMIMLGALAKVTGLIDIHTIGETLQKRFSGSILEMNKSALQEGYKWNYNNDRVAIVAEDNEVTKVLDKCESSQKEIKHEGKIIGKKASINSLYCKGCGLCVTYCPSNCLTISENVNSNGIKIAMMESVEKCTGCAICYRICPDIAIRVE